MPTPTADSEENSKRHVSHAGVAREAVNRATYARRSRQRAPRYPPPRRTTCTDGILEVRGASVDAQSALKRARASLQKQLICVLALLPVPGSLTAVRVMSRTNSVRQRSEGSAAREQQCVAAAMAAAPAPAPHHDALQVGGTSAFGAGAYTRPLLSST